ncbi:MAG: hypothetical protein NT154_23515, partial [Verrucomicrobia bacterium]|nr:hypothetical protein [Verrucomicrobiota bacterium]
KRVARRQGEKATLALLLKHLRQNQIIPTPLAKAVQSPTELIAQDYHQYLLHERSLGEETSKGYIGIIRRFLLNRFPNQKVELKKLHTKDIGEFVLHNTTRQGRRACHNTQLPHCAVSFAFSFKKGKPLQTWQWLSPQ